MMRIDAWTHFIPKPFADKMAEIAGNFADIGKRMREIPCIHDLDERRRVVGMFPDYAQILSHGMPPVENVVQGQQTEELCKLINDGFADICSKHQSQFPGWIAQISLGHPEGAVREAQRAIEGRAQQRPAAARERQELLGPVGLAPRPEALAAVLSRRANVDQGGSWLADGLAYRRPVCPDTRVLAAEAEAGGRRSARGAAPRIAAGSPGVA